MAYPSIVSALEGVDFPINKSELMSKVGDREVEVLEGQMMSMRELLDACPHDTYNGTQDVVKCPEIVGKIEGTKAA